MKLPPTFPEKRIKITNQKYVTFHDTKFHWGLGKGSMNELRRKKLEKQKSWQLTNLVQLYSGQLKEEEGEFLDSSAFIPQVSHSGSFPQTLPELVTPLHGHSLSPSSCPPTCSEPSERFGYWQDCGINVVLKHGREHEASPPWV